VVASFEVPVRDPDDAIVGKVKIESGPAATCVLYPDRLYVEAPGSITIAPVGFTLTEYVQAALRLTDLSAIHSSCLLDVTPLDGDGTGVGGSSHSIVGEALEIALVAGTAAIRLALVQLVHANVSIWPFR